MQFHKADEGVDILLKLGIVGTGSIATEYLKRLHLMANIEIVSICGTARSRDVVESLCRQYQIPHGYTHVQKLLASDIDTVYVAVPNHLHYEVSRKALLSGKNVIVEKPFTSTYEEAKQLAALAKERKLFLYEAILTMYQGNYYKVRELLHRIGIVHMVSCAFTQYSRRYDQLLAGERHPVFDPDKSGGALMDLNVYNLHYVIGLFGRPTKGHYYPFIEKGVDTSGVAVLEYPTFQAVCMGAKNCASLGAYAIQGERGSICQSTPANLCGPVMLKLCDGATENYDENAADSMFLTMITQMEQGDFDACYSMLEHSLCVMDVITEMQINMHGCKADCS